MDHAEARELFELAAAEPGGLERLAAGDRPEAAALAGHLAGCPPCAAELERLRAAAAVIREAVRSMPAPELRDRTLAYVAAVGRPRGGAAGPRDLALSGATAGGPAAGPESDRRAAWAPLAAPRGRALTRGRLAAIAAVLALVAVAGAGGFLAGAAQPDPDAGRREQAIGALERVTAASLRIAGQPDARHVALVGDPPSAEGTLLYSPGTRELVVVARGLPRPDAGREFRCWVEVDGVRRPVGRMFFADDLAFWVGKVDAVGALPDGSGFGVTLVDASGDSLDGPATLSGEQ